VPLASSVSFENTKQRSPNQIVKKDDGLLGPFGLPKEVPVRVPLASSVTFENTKQKSPNQIEIEKYLYFFQFIM
jgi:hypothetical protein